MRHLVYFSFVTFLCIHRKYGLDIKDFGPSWRDGHAFNAIIHSINPGLVNMDELQYKTARDNLEDAFRKAEEHLGIPRLLDPEGMLMNITIMIMNRCTELQLLTLFS